MRYDNALFEYPTKDWVKPHPAFLKADFPIENETKKKKQKKEKIKEAAPPLAEQPQTKCNCPRCNPQVVAPVQPQFHQPPPQPQPQPQPKKEEKKPAIDIASLLPLLMGGGDTSSLISGLMNNKDSPKGGLDIASLLPLLSNLGAKEKTSEITKTINLDEYKRIR